jgi:hypothetical protein
MAKDKKLDSDLEAVWDAVRRDRRARRKLISKSELEHSAAILRGHAGALDALAANAPTAGAPADAAAAPEASADAEAKPKRKRRSAKRSKKAKDG